MGRLGMDRVDDDDSAARQQIEFGVQRDHTPSGWGMIREGEAVAFALLCHEVSLAEDGSAHVQGFGENRTEALVVVRVIEILPVVARSLSDEDGSRRRLIQEGGHPPPPRIWDEDAHGPFSWEVGKVSIDTQDDNFF
jgi:hypothetical protein